MIRMYPFHHRIFYIIQHDGRAIITFLEPHPYIFEDDVLSMANIEAVGWQLAKHGELGIFLDLLWHILHPPERDVGLALGGTAGIFYLDILQRHLAYTLPVFSAWMSCTLMWLMLAPSTLSMAMAER